MKRMIRILMIAICCMLSCNMAANAGNDKPIAVNALPIKAQTLLSNHFNNQKVMLATIETGVINKTYDVVLQNGTKLEFDKKGNLTEIDCKQGTVPDQLIPQAIKNYLKENPLICEEVEAKVRAKYSPEEDEAAEQPDEKSAGKTTGRTPEELPAE